MDRIKKISLRAGIILFLFVIVVLGLLSPIAKYLIEKYDKEITGREITLDWAFVSPFNGYVYLNDVVIYEQDNTTSFLSMEGLSVNFSLFRLISGDYELSSVTLRKPVGYVIQTDSVFNFTDIIAKFSGDTTRERSGEPARVSLLDIEIKEGEFHYLETVTPISYFITHVNINSEGWRNWVDTLAMDFDFSAGIRTGETDGYFVINTANLDYRLDARIDSFDLELVNQYMKALTTYGTFSALLHADLKTKGNFTSVDSMEIRGDLSINQFHFGKSKEVDFVNFDRLVIGIDELSPKRMIYHFDSVLLEKPYCSYELYDSLDNIQTMFGAGGAIVAENANSAQFNLIIEIAKGVQLLSRNFLASHYQVKCLSINEGDFHYADFTMGEEFNVAMHPFFLHADSISKSNERVNVRVSTGIWPYGDFKLALSINPRDSSNFDLDCSLTKVPLTVFNPYFVDLTSYPLDRGTLEFTGQAHVREGQIHSVNHLLILDPRITKRRKNGDAHWLPLPIAMAVLRENGNVIDYTIPIEGNLNDPHFVLKDVILDVLTNIFVKPITTPYRVEVKKVERQIEKSLTLQWPMHSSVLTGTQEKGARKIADFLEENPGTVITVIQNPYMIKEKEFILLFEAKKRYFLTVNKRDGYALNKEDSVVVAKMSIKDPAFLRFLNASVSDPTLFTVQHKAERLIPAEVVNAKMEALARARRRAFLLPFKERDVAGRVRFVNGENTLPYNGYSFFGISYTGGFPEFLHDAFEKMDHLDESKPREPYKRKREKLGLRLRKK